jgi:hypothetical protein
MEVTKWLKSSGSQSRIGDGASVQAVRVNAEQASKRTTRRLARQSSKSPLIFPSAQICLGNALGAALIPAVSGRL